MQTQAQEQRIFERRWWTLAVLALSLLVIGLDNTILNVALPTLALDLKASGSQLQWLVDSYVLVFAGLLLTAGNLGDRFGRKWALFAGLIVFAIGSLLSAYSGSAEHLILTRALMGAGGAFIMPTTLSILTNIFPARERGRAIALWAAVFGLAIPLGPVVGGWLLEHFWWGSVFLVNLPVVALALVSGFFLVPNSKNPEEAQLDPPGALLSIAGLAALLYAIIEAPNRGWTDPAILAVFGVAVVLLGLFALWELRTPHPLLDTHLFENARFTAASVAVTLVFFALFGTIFFLTQYLQFVLRYSALEAGYRMVPIAAGILVGAPLSARLAERIGTKLVVTAGLLIVSLGLYIMSFVSQTSGYSLILITLLIVSFGMGMAMAPATDSIMGAVPKEHAGVGSAVNDTTRQVGGALGVAVLGSLLSTFYSQRIADVATGFAPPAAKMVEDSIGEAARVAQTLDPATAGLLMSGARDAFIHAMGTTVLIGAGFAFAGAVVAFLFLPARDPVVEAERRAAAEEKAREQERQQERERMEV
ncbi:MAG TPA: MFS transporter [Thermomicrobiaceae bacterium]|nr:MFS transporter [Thermomicrobiaceae bacterium]